MKNIEKIIHNNIDITLVKTDKFKSLSACVVFLGEFNKEMATSRSLLTRVLSNTTKKYNTKKLFTDKLFDLYDANISISSYPLYKTNLTIFSLSVVNPKYVNEKDLYEEAFSLLKEVIFNPNIENESFLQSVFLEEKRILRDQINNTYNNKSLYAFNRLLQEMGKDEIFSISSLGTIEDLEKITPHSLYNHYQKMLNEEMAKVFILGDINETDVKRFFSTYPFTSNVKKLEVSATVQKKIDKVNEVVEVQDINQSQLMMGFRTNIGALDPLYMATSLFNMMFGGMVSSDLFRVVREEHSLAYSVYSTAFFDNKLMIINAGIDQEKYQLTTDLIIKELEKYKNKEIDEELLQVAKDNLISSLKEVYDEPFSYLMFIMKNSLLKGYTIDDLMEMANKVTVDDIYKASQQIELDTIYLLKGDRNEGN